MDRRTPPWVIYCTVRQRLFAAFALHAMYEVSNPAYPTQDPWKDQNPFRGSQKFGQRITRCSQFLPTSTCMIDQNRAIKMVPDSGPQDIVFGVTI